MPIDVPRQPRPLGRSARLRQLLRDVIAQRNAGEVLSDEAVIAGNCELMPELGEQLHALRCVEQGKRAAPEGVPCDETMAPSGPDAQTADELASRLPAYECIQAIHCGGQGVVYGAVHTTSGREVAIKVVRGGPFAVPQAQARLEREIQILRNLDHPNIVVVREDGSFDGGLYYVMDYVRGIPVDQYIRAQTQDHTGTLTARSGIEQLECNDQADAVGRTDPESLIRKTVRLFIGVCDAVNAAHQKGVIHRDLKPSNILVDEDGEPRVLDFGLAKLLGPNSNDASRAQALTTTSQFVGTLPWAAPEQIRGDVVTAASDVYSLGVILYDLLTGQFPYPVHGNQFAVSDSVLHAEPVKLNSIRKHIDRNLDAVLLKCLRKECEYRYESASELRRDLARYLAGSRVAARRDNACYVVRRFLAKRRFTAVALVVLAGVLLAGTGVATVLRRGVELEQQRAELERHRAELRYGRACLEQGDPVRGFSALAKEFRRRHTDHAWFPLLAWWTGHPCRYELPIGRQRVVRYSPNGRWIASVDSEGRVTVYEADRGNLAQTMPADSAHARCLAFSPDGKRILTGGTDGRIRVWAFDPDTADVPDVPIITLTSPTGTVDCLVVSPHGSCLAAGSEAGIVRVWKGAADGSFQVAHQWSGTGPITSLVFSTDGTRLAATAHTTQVDDRTRPGGVWVWDLEDREQVRHVDRRVCRGVAFSDDGEHLFFGEQGLSVWNLATGEVAPLEGESRWGVRAIDVSRFLGSRFVAVAAGDGRIRFYDTHLRMVLNVQGFHDNDGPDRLDVRFSPTGSTLATVGCDGLKAWDFLPAGNADLVTERGACRAMALDVGPEGDRIVIAATPETSIRGRYGRVREATAIPLHRHQLFCWQRSANRLLPLESMPAASCRAVSLAADGQAFAAAMNKPAPPQLLVVAGFAGPEPQPRVVELAHSPSAMLWIEHDPPAILVGSEDGLLNLVRVTRGRERSRVEQVHEFKKPDCDAATGCTHLAMSRDGQWLAASWEGPRVAGGVTLWRATGRNLADHAFEQAYDLQAEFATHRYTWNVAFAGTEDGEPVLATVGSSKDVHLWNASAGQRIHRLSGHTDIIRQCRALRDGILVTASDDRTVRIWDASQGVELCVLHRSRAHTPVIGVRDGCVVIADGSVVSVIDTEDTPPFIAEMVAQTASRPPR